MSAPAFKSAAPYRVLDCGYGRDGNWSHATVAVPEEAIDADTAEINFKHVGILDVTVTLKDCFVALPDSKFPPYFAFQISEVTSRGSRYLPIAETVKHDPKTGEWLAVLKSGVTVELSAEDVKAIKERREALVAREPQRGLGTRIHPESAIYSVGAEAHLVGEPREFDFTQIQQEVRPEKTWTSQPGTPNLGALAEAVGRFAGSEPTSEVVIQLQNRPSADLRVQQAQQMQPQHDHPQGVLDIGL